MDTQKPESPVSPQPEQTQEKKHNIPACCVETIKFHSTHNPMMVCNHCKQIIKCFAEESAYRNYLTFCRSRHRRVETGFVHNLYTVVFRSYESYR